MVLIALHHVDVIFGRNVKSIFPLLDQGIASDEIRRATQHTIAVRNASVSIEAGEIFVLMGLSGSGKSSLLRCLNGLTQINRGSIIFDGKPIPYHDRAYLQTLRRNRISMVFQQFSLLPWRTVAQNVEFGIEVNGISKNLRNQIIEESLEKVGLSEWKDHYPHHLSGGMKQRVGIARALATNAEVLLMDEPFSALDPLTRTKLQKELKNIQKNLGKTIVFVTHDLAEAITLGTKIGIMEGGQLVQVDTPANILKNPATEYVKEFVKTVYEATQILPDSSLHLKFSQATH